MFASFYGGYKVCIYRNIKKKYGFAKHIGLSWKYYRNGTVEEIPYCTKHKIKLRETQTSYFCDICLDKNKEYRKEGIKLHYDFVKRKVESIIDKH